LVQVGGGVDDFFLKADLGDVRADCVFEEKKNDYQCLIDE